MSDGLYFSINDLVYAMGINKAVVLTDIRTGILKTVDDRIEYMEAINYTHKKYAEGIEMYPPNGFESRLLAVIKGHIAKFGYYE